MYRLLHRAPPFAALFLCTGLLISAALLAGCRRGEKPAEAPVAGPADQPSTAQVADRSEANQKREADEDSAPPAAESEATGSANAELDQPDAAEPASESAATQETDAELKTGPQPTWSTLRLVLLAPGGPRLVELRVNVAGRDLAEGFADATESLAEELDFRFDSPISWDALLEKPLVRSGWLGNLVPSFEQRAELLAMYDQDNVGMVDRVEFAAFLTRGLTRRSHLRLVHARATAAPLMRSNSPWGELDQDEDGELSEQELSRTGDALMHFDFDGDGIITESELRSNSEAMRGPMNMSRSSGLLDVTHVLTPDAKSNITLERAVHEHYSFTETLSRETFFGWDDQRWKQIDREAKGEIVRRDLESLCDMPADAQLNVALPSSLELSDSGNSPQPEGPPDESVDGSLGEPVSQGSVVSVASESKGDKKQIVWTAGPSGGRLLLPGCVVLVQVSDDHSPEARGLAMERFSQAADDKQLAAAITNRLELKESAWQLLAEQGSQGPSRAWRWTAAPRHFHVTATWTAVEHPWFELVDANGDRRLTGLELSDFHASAGRWDRNFNGRLEEEELPLVISMRIAREDNRFAGFLPGGTNVKKGVTNAPQGPSWFTGMDYNSDGELTHAEFLGEDTAFEALDANRDGIIDVREVYAPH
ncbi:MAG: hypothetical protein ACTHK7_04825 [Aureliella sp.]